ncbi:hypothetical protein C8J57DRAFT_1364526, partial [Mycena rebaudengoi]
MLELKFKMLFWERGDFPNVVQNGRKSTIPGNPWVNGTKTAPFDQSFFLPDHKRRSLRDERVVPEKPWLYGSATAPRDFLQAKD